MSKKQQVIDKLTPEQEAKLPEYVKRFTEIGLSTRPTDRTKAEAALVRHYGYYHKSNGSMVEKPEIIWADSPMKGAILAAQYAKGNEDVTTTEVQEQANLASYGSLEAYWVSTWAFIANELPVEKDDLIDIAVEIVEECGVYWVFEDLVVMTPKPSAIVLNKEGKLHNAEGPAMQWPNGDSIYAFDGVSKGSLMEVAIANRIGTSKTEDGEAA